MASLRNYTGYSFGCAVAWAAVLILVAAVYPDRLHTYVLVCAGWVIGWISATIARSVYPPPRRNSRAT
jgi:pimeloyl-ACP methyl ester carboxylesterase